MYARCMCNVYCNRQTVRAKHSYYFKAISSIDSRFNRSGTPSLSVTATLSLKCRVGRLKGSKHKSKEENVEVAYDGRFRYVAPPYAVLIHFLVLPWRMRCS